MSSDYEINTAPHRRRWLLPSIIAVCLLLSIAAYIAIGHKTPLQNMSSLVSDQLKFTASVSASEQKAITTANDASGQKLYGSISIETTSEAADSKTIVEAYVPVTSFGAARQAVSKKDLTTLKVFVPADTDEVVMQAIAGSLGLEPNQLSSFSKQPSQLSDQEVLFLPASKLTPDVKLLAFENNYYLDNTLKGAIFRVAKYGDAAQVATSPSLNNLPGKDAIFTINQTGVTALARTMQQKLATVKDPTYFSQKIGDFLASTDLTHISNEVSFKPNCAYSHTSFCADPRFIDTLKASGTDVVELTGNHNNDGGNQYNTDTINLYHSLGWGTFGGGLNSTEAAKPYIADRKGSKVAFVGYNDADGINSGVIATATTAGGNHFDAEQAKTDISNAHKQADFVIVDMQYLECYAYPPAGFVEMPDCDKPIPNQTGVFRSLIDEGADMVVGTQAHQPQTYEIYHGKPIYYGLGNLYFEQTQQPGTERGIVLTHYFAKGKLLQTKLTPTVYDTSLQTHIMTQDQATPFLQRLAAAQP